MDTHLHALASEVLARVEAHHPPTDRPQLLASHGDQALVREAEGLSVRSHAALPPLLDLAHLIDHTLLKPQAHRGDIDRLCDEARTHGFASVCVNPLWVERAAQRLQGSPVRVCTVVGFPLGATTSRSKAEEAREALAQGAREVDMVLALGLVKSGDWDGVRKDFERLREATAGAVLKVILETCLLTDDEKVQACRCAVEAGLDFVKTSTGFSTGGATEADVVLMRSAVGTRCGVKASGGIRDYATALRMVFAGATRLGLSNGLAVVSGSGTEGSGY